jgi:hypothetical protein
MNSRLCGDTLQAKNRYISMRVRGGPKDNGAGDQIGDDARSETNT